MIRRFLLTAVAALLAPLGAEGETTEAGVPGIGEGRTVRAVAVGAPGALFEGPDRDATPSPEAAPSAGSSVTECARRAWRSPDLRATSVSPGIHHQHRLLQAGHRANRLDLPPPPRD